MAALAEQFIRDADDYRGDQAVNFATAAVYGALALRLDSGYTSQSLHTFLGARDIHNLRMLAGAKLDEPIGGELYLYEALNLPWRAQRPNASGKDAAGCVDKAILPVPSRADVPDERQ